MICPMTGNTFLHSACPASANAWYSGSDRFAMCSMAFSAMDPLLCSTSPFFTTCLHALAMLGHQCPSPRGSSTPSTAAAYDTYVCRVLSMVPTQQSVTPNASRPSSVMALRSSSPIRSVISSVFRPYLSTTSRRSASVSATGMRRMTSLISSPVMPVSNARSTVASSAGGGASSPGTAVLRPSGRERSTPAPPSDIPTRVARSTSIIFVKFATWSSSTLVCARDCSMSMSIFFWDFAASARTARCTSSTALWRSASLAFMNSWHAAFFSGSAATAAGPPSSAIFSASWTPCSYSSITTSWAAMLAAAAMMVT